MAKVQAMPADWFTGGADGGPAIGLWLGLANAYSAERAVAPLPSRMPVRAEVTPARAKAPIRPVASVFSTRGPSPRSDRSGLPESNRRARSDGSPSCTTTRFNGAVQLKPTQSGPQDATNAGSPASSTSCRS